MSMSTYVMGIVPANAEYKKMLHVYDACMNANISVPDEVDDFFNGEAPSRDGMEVRLDIPQDNSVDMQDAFVVTLSELPANVTKIKFVNSY